MKKLLFSIISLLLSILLISCGTLSHKNTATGEGEISKTQEAEDTFPYILDEDNNIIGVVDHTYYINPIRAMSYPSYQEFINRVNLPDDFIPYEKFSYLGEFENLVFLTSLYEPDYRQYLYGFVNNGEVISLYVYHDEDAVEQIRSLKSRRSLTAEDIDLENMRYAKQEEPSYYYYQGIYYCYFAGGTLISIQWESDDVFYVLHPPGLGFPSENSYLNELLNKLLVPESALEIISSMAPPDVEQ